MTREFLSVPLWRWSVAAIGLTCLVAAVGLAVSGDPWYGACLSGARQAAGHCPLCWTAFAALLVAGAPNPWRRGGPIWARGRQANR